MLGSFHDAEDAAQETLLRAWRGLDRFEGRASPRAWFYRIATNVCLTTLARAKTRRVLPETQGPPVEFAPLGESENEIAWLEPYPDAALDRVRDLAPGPEARYEMREAVQLAFIAAIQQLPPRQRATLLFRDVLGWSAQETADLLESTVASINSALQRARTTLRQRLPGSEIGTAPPPDDRQRVLLMRYVRAWESSDIDAFVALLREDAVWTMPPWREWFVGRPTIRAFVNWAWRPERGRRQHLVPTSANGLPAFGYYRSERGASEWRAFAIQVLTLQDDAIVSVTNFVDSRLFAAFGLPLILPRTDDR
jgi:RNA polymerase sigma-70 factor (ECF subfamily)